MADGKALHGLAGVMPAAPGLSREDQEPPHKAWRQPGSASVSHGGSRESSRQECQNALGAFYRRIQARSGGGKALIATARKIACRYYRLLKYGQQYVRQELAAYEELYRLRLIKGLARKATELGYQLVATTKT
jgi:hypothetical protein